MMTNINDYNRWCYLLSHLYFFNIILSTNFSCLIEVVWFIGKGGVGGESGMSHRTLISKKSWACMGPRQWNRQGVCGGHG